MLYNYVLWYNEYEGLWYAIDRNTQIDFFSGKRSKSTYFSNKSVEVLIKKLS